ncbi:MAG: FtsQ-type POTRA domain-containing protein [Alphaproteobacteria bacterium]
MPRLNPFVNPARKKEVSSSSSKKSPASKRAAAKTRRPAPSKWRKPAMLAAGAAVLVAGMTAGAFSVWNSGWMIRQSAALDREIAQISKSLGLAVQSVTVSGRRETDRKDLIDALGIDIGDPIFNIDVAAARDRIERIGWVKTATISRKLPGTVQIDIEEREAVAIWQHDGVFTLIDPDGHKIGTKGLERYGHLKVLVGDGAPDQAIDLIGILKTEPELMTKVTGAVWVGSRRWNVRLNNGIDIRLPEEDPVEAWARLAQLERDYSLLGRAIEAIDLRQSDRMIVRMTEEAAEMRRARKDET